MRIYIYVARYRTSGLGRHVSGVVSGNAKGFFRYSTCGRICGYIHQAVMPGRLAYDYIILDYIIAEVIRCIIAEGRVVLRRFRGVQVR